MLVSHLLFLWTHASVYEYCQCTVTVMEAFGVLASAGLARRGWRPATQARVAAAAGAAMHAWLAPIHVSFALSRMRLT